MNSDEIQVGEKIRKLRKEQELSQEDLAEALGVSRQSVIALEQDKYMPSLPLVIEMCRFFDSAFEEIFEIEREIDVAINQIEDSMTGNPKITAGPIAHDSMDQFFEGTASSRVPSPRIDIMNKEDVVMIRAELPGVSEDNVEIEILNNQMTIKGTTSQESGEYFHKESHHGSFSRTFSLPGEVVADKAEAEIENGVMTVAVPKVKPKTAKKVSIKAKKRKK